MSCRPTAAAVLVVAIATAGCLAANPAPRAPDADDAVTLSCGPCQVVVATGPDHAYEPWLAADPNDGAHLVALAMQWGDRGPWIHASTSFDAGATWTQTRLPGGASSPPSHPLAGATALADPSVAITNDGSVVVAGFAVTGTPIGPTNPVPQRPPATAPIAAKTQVFVAVSQDGGRSFPDVRLLHEAGVRIDGASAAGQAAPDVAVDRTELTHLFGAPDGRLALTWANQTRLASRSSELLITLSRDSGRTWSEARSIGQGFGAAGAFGAGDRVYLTFNRGGNLTFAVSTDAGRSWEFTNLGRMSSWLAPISMDEGEQILIAYGRPLDEETLGLQEPTVVVSDDEGSSWSNPVGLDPPEAAGRALVAADASPDGTLFVSYFHAKHDGPTSFRATAFRDGVAGDPLVLSESIGDLARGRAGEYQGLAAVPDGAFVTWVAENGGRDALFVAKVFREAGP
ncbi:MAG: sialidase family protein [Methanobacteriota archaeon]